LTLTAIPTPPYPKAPITEAVIHLQVGGNATADEQEKLVKRFGADYPQSKKLSGLSVTVNTTGGAATVEQRAQGFRLTNSDQTDILLVFPNGIATARLAPYPGWPHLRKRAEAAWAQWRRTVTSSQINRIGIRNINRIDVPIRDRPAINFDTYLHFRPLVPHITGGPLRGYLLQVTFPAPSSHWNVSIASSIVAPPPLIDNISFLLDIDVFRSEQIPGREDELWTVIDEARAIKNTIFERCITDETRKLFV
jgi:uncharacterized protein (TIGR04255 family)